MFGSYGSLQSSILCKLFKSYCCSFYGSQLWTLDSSGFKSCCTQWNKAIRKILHVPYQTHTWLLGPLSDQYHISVQLYVKTLRFIYSLFNSSNSTVSFVGMLARQNATSPAGRNMAMLRNKFNVDFRESLHHNITLVFNAHKLSVEREILLHNLSDLNQAVENDLNIEGFDNEMIYAMITNILIG